MYLSLSLFFLNLCTSVETDAGYHLSVFQLRASEENLPEHSLPTPGPVFRTPVYGTIVISITEPASRNSGSHQTHDSKGLLLPGFFLPIPLTETSMSRCPFLSVALSFGEGTFPASVVPCSSLVLLGNWTTPLSCTSSWG